ncbi:alpha/beta hydrolase [Limibacterium fermenti]|uniref:alpha/beta hydrolase n=1 Tax=Limibacterium fermenti TaxID=3229863 RepID=UPI003A714FA7
MKHLFSFIVVALFLSYGFSFAADVDTVAVPSKGMNINSKTVIITPDNYRQGTRYPVLYLLHGYSGNYSDWVKAVPGVKQLSDDYGMIIVCPDGAYGSWYFDSPVDSAFAYETYVAKELVEWVDANYKTIPTREGRAITGLSMGGHGGLYLAFRHQDVFGAAGSMSGGVDIRPFPNNWDIAKRLGKQSDYPERWEQNTVIGMLHLLTPNSLKFIIDCGSEDFFYDVNVRLHEELLYRNIPHDFISRPGVHDWKYWSNAVKYQALFFHTYFEEGRSGN